MQVRMPKFMDWTNKEAVIALAAKLGDNIKVVKYTNRPNYNITHKTRVVKDFHVVIWEA